MPIASRKTTSRLTAVKDYIKVHFALKSGELLRDGRRIDPKYPINRKRPRVVAIKSFGGQSVAWTVAQIRLLLQFGDLPHGARVMYLDGDQQNDALDNLRLMRRSTDRAPRREPKMERYIDDEGYERKGIRIPFPKGVTRWRIASDIPPRYAGWIRIGDNELLLGLFDTPWDAQKAIQAARDAAWSAILSPNDHARMDALKALIRKRRTATTLKAIASQLELLDPPPADDAPQPDLVVPSPVGDALIHDGWHKPSVERTDGAEGG